MRDSANDPIPQEAAAWLARKDRGMTAAEERAFAGWQAADPRHAAEYARFALAWKNFDLAKAVPDLAKIARQLDQRTSAHPLRRRRAIFGWAFVAAAAAVALGLGLWRWRETGVDGGAPPASYHVVPNASKRLVLEDGSVAELRGNSEIRVEFTASERKVNLLRGEAFFTVAKNRARPFIVGAGQITVRAVGTAFSVQIAPSQVEVMVTEGEVSLGGAPLRDSSRPGNAAGDPAAVPIVFAGQLAFIVGGATASGVPATVKVALLKPLEIDEALSWQNTWLVFKRTTLSDAVEAFNRHSSQQLILGDPSLQGRRLDGKFQADHVEGFVRLIEQTMHLQAERRDRRTIILMPAQ